MSDRPLHLRIADLPAELRAELESATRDVAAGRWVSTNAWQVPVAAWVVAFLAVTPYIAYRVHLVTTQHVWLREDLPKELPVAIALAALWMAAFATARHVGTNGWAATSFGLVRRRGARLTIWPWSATTRLDGRAGASPSLQYDPMTGQVAATTTETERMARRVAGDPAHEAVGAVRSGGQWLVLTPTQGEVAEVFFPKARLDLAGRFSERVAQAQREAVVLPAGLPARRAPLSPRATLGLGVLVSAVLGGQLVLTVGRSLYNDALHDRFVAPRLFGGRSPAPEHLAIDLEHYLHDFPDSPHAELVRGELGRRRRAEADALRADLLSREHCRDNPWPVTRFLQLAYALEREHGDTTYAHDREHLTAGSGELAKWQAWVRAQPAR